jgi:hypothetical protein
MKKSCLQGIDTGENCMVQFWRNVAVQQFLAPATYCNMKNCGCQHLFCHNRKNILQKTLDTGKLYMI